MIWIGFLYMLRKLDLCVTTASMTAPMEICFWTLLTNTHTQTCIRTHAHNNIWIDAIANIMLTLMQMSFSIYPLSPFCYTNDECMEDWTRAIINSCIYYYQISKLNFSVLCKTKYVLRTNSVMFDIIKYYFGIFFIYSVILGNLSRIWQDSGAIPYFQK